MFKLLEFVFFTETGSAANARFKALEIVSTTTLWLNDKEDEIIAAFSGAECGVSQKDKNLPRKSAKMAEKFRSEFEKKFPNKLTQKI